MIRVVNESHKWYAVEVGKELTDEELDNISTFVNGGQAVILAANLDDVRAVIGDDEEIEMVE